MCGNEVILKQQLKAKFDYLADDEIDSIYNMALSDYVTYRYPFPADRPKIGDFVIDFYVSNWIYKRMLDIVSRANGLSLTAYRENGLSLEFAGSSIDSTLISEVVPKARVPK